MRTIEVNYNSVTASSMESVIVKSWNNEVVDNTAGNNIKTYLQQTGMTGHAYTMGRDSVAITKEWSQHGAKDTTPKTDIVIGDARISVKVAPSAQLMSGGKEETLSTFMNNIEYIQDNEYEKTLSNEIINNFRFFISGTISGRVSTAIKQKTDIDITNGDSAHKKIMFLLNELFELNKTFKFNFIKESMTGIKKFGTGSIGSCTHLLTVSKDGKFCNLKNVNDDEYIQHICDNTKVSVRFKSTSVKRQNVKTGEYRYWSVLGLIVNNLSKIKEN